MPILEAFVVGLFFTLGAVTALVMLWSTVFAMAFLSSVYRAVRGR